MTEGRAHMGTIGEQIQEVEPHRRGLLPMAVIVGEFITMIFMDVKLLILNLPARASDLHDHGHVGCIDLEISNPTIVIEQLATKVSFPHLQVIHAYGAL